MSAAPEANRLRIRASGYVVSVSLLEHPICFGHVSFSSGENGQRRGQVTATGQIVSVAVSRAQGLEFRLETGRRCPPGEQEGIGGQQQTVLPDESTPVAVAG